MVLPLAASILWLAPISYNTNGLIGDWHGLVYYGALLLYGAFLFGSPEVLAALNRQRWLSFAIGVAAYAALYVVFFEGTVRPTIADADRPVFALLSAVNTMAWLFAIIGFANRHLTRRPAFLADATEAVYPFYILHQTVTVIAVYWLLQIGAPPVAGFILAVLATFVGTSAIYFGLVRPVWFLRPLFGLKAAYNQDVRPALGPDLAFAHHAELLQRALTGPVVRPRDGDHAIEFRDVEGEGKGGAAKLGPVALALRFGREGQAYGHAIVAGMHAQAAQPDQLAGRAFRRRPAAEAQRRPLGLVGRRPGRRSGRASARRAAEDSSRAHRRGIPPVDPHRPW